MVVSLETWKTKTPTRQVTPWSTETRLPSDNGTSPWNVRGEVHEIDRDPCSVTDRKRKERLDNNVDIHVEVLGKRD